MPRERTAASFRGDFRGLLPFLRCLLGCLKLSPWKKKSLGGVQTINDIECGEKGSLAAHAVVEISLAFCERWEAEL